MAPYPICGGYNCVVCAVDPTGAEALEAALVCGVNISRLAVGVELLVGAGLLGAKFCPSGLHPVLVANGTILGWGVSTFCGAGIVKLMSTAP